MQQDDPAAQNRQADRPDVRILRMPEDRELYRESVEPKRVEFPMRCAAQPTIADIERAGLTRTGCFSLRAGVSECRIAESPVLLFGRRRLDQLRGLGRWIELVSVEGGLVEHQSHAIEGTDLELARPHTDGVKRARLDA